MKILGIFFISVFPCISFAGNTLHINLVDSLTKTLKENNSPKSVLTSIYALSDAYQTINIDSSRALSENGLLIALDQADSLMIAKFRRQLGAISYNNGDYDAAVEFHNKVLAYFKRSQHQEEIAISYNQLGKTLIQKQEFEKAYNFFDRSIQISQEIENKSTEGKAYSYLAYLFYLQQEYKKSLRIYLKSQQTLKLLGDRHLSTIAENANVIGSIYLGFENIIKSLEAFKESLEIHKKIGNPTGVAYASNNIGLVYQELNYFDEALPHHLDALQIRRAEKDSLKIAYSLFDLGNFYKKQKRDKEALEYYIEGLDICRLINDSSFTSSLLIGIGEVYVDRENASLARKYWDEAKTYPTHANFKFFFLLTKIYAVEEDWSRVVENSLRLYNKTKNISFFLGQHEVVSYLVEAYQNLENPIEALKYSLIKQTLTDSLNRHQHARVAQQMAFEYETERKEVAFNDLEKESELQKNKIEKQQDWLYLMLFIGLVIFAISLLLIFLFLKNKKIAEKESALRGSILNLFTNISHELRTPLAILQPSVEQLTKNQSTRNEQIIKIVTNNINRLVELVDQIVDLAIVKEQHLNLNLELGNPIDFLHFFTRKFSLNAENQQLDLVLKIPSESLNIHFDEIVLTKILNNIIINAFKSTIKGGIMISFRYLTNHMEFKIQDTGSGIAKEDLISIFERYYQKPSKNKGSTEGIGLSVVKEMVLLYKGTIETESLIDKGTTFIIKLPFPESFTPEEVPDKFEIVNFNVNVPKRYSNVPISELAMDAETLPTTIKRVLIIEDNVDLNTLISNHLGQYFQINAAFDLEEIFSIAQKMPPDLILIDINMLKMDGFGFAQKLHDSIETRHVSLLIIGAYQDSIITEFRKKLRVVDFIHKPLDLDGLVIKINRIFDSREQIKSRLQKKERGNNIIINAPIATRDKEFLEKLDKILYENISDVDLNIDKISKMMFVSRIQLFRKIKVLTGLTPVKYIHKNKLKYAHNLLINGTIDNVTEVARKAGYKNLSFFSRKFKEEFGINATTLLKNNRERFH